MSDEKPIDPMIHRLDIEMVQLRERLAAADSALKLAREELVRYQETNNHWRQAMNDQRISFVTRSELVASVSVIISLILLAMRFIH